MDVGNPSNFARLMDFYDGNYNAISKEIRGISFDDHQTKEIIQHVYHTYNYLMCPHTAIGYGGLKHYLKPDAIGVYLSTAHPCKFKDIVDPLISSEVEIPLRLQHIINKKKQAISMKAAFNEFKSYLLES